MKILQALKYPSLTLLYLLTGNFAKAQLLDTAVYLYKITGSSPVIVNNPDSADYIRVISPFTASQAFIDVNDYYKDGSLKFTGKAERRFFNQVTGYVVLNGTCMGFFPSKKRESITNYTLFGKDGAEYLYYPDGKLYKFIENKINPSTHISEGKLIECFDKDGMQICKEGNGRAVDYNSDFSAIVEEGVIKKGKKDGGWIGKISTDASKYVILYKDGLLKSGTGYDHKGNPYSFNKIYEEADYKNGPTGFITKFKSLLISIKENKQAKKAIDTTTITFVVNEDGHLTDLKTINKLSPELIQVLKDALNQSPVWQPTRFYGIPLKTKVELSLRVSSAHDGSNSKSVMYSLTPYYGAKLLERIPARLLNISF